MQGRSGSIGDGGGSIGLIMIIPEAAFTRSIITYSLMDVAVTIFFLIICLHVRPDDHSIREARQREEESSAHRSGRHAGNRARM